MATNHVRGEIKRWDYPAVSDIASDDAVEIGTVLAVALADIASGETGAVGVTGTFALPKGVGALAQGAAVDFDGTNIIPTAGSKIGVVADAAESGDATVNVELER